MATAMAALFSPFNPHYRTRTRTCPTRLFPVSFKLESPLSRQTTNSPKSRGKLVKKRILNGKDSCLVIPPPNGEKPIALIKFLGGAFVGAVPEATYSHLMELLAREGFLIISIPYKVTFDHTEASTEVFERFQKCMDVLSTNGIPGANLLPYDLLSLPTYSVGHSNGALLQLLIGSSYSEKIPEANVIISFNNRPASEAVPYFEQVKFNADTIDETDQLEDILRPRVESIGGTLEKVILPGNHLTPCVQDFKWEVGYYYTPADAVAQSFKTLSLNDTRVLARTIVDWLKGIKNR